MKIPTYLRRRAERLAERVKTSAAIVLERALAAGLAKLEADHALDELERTRDEH